MHTEPSYLNRGDTTTDPSNGDADPNVQRELQQVGSGSCLGTDSCTDVTSASEIGVNSCLAFKSCYELDGMYNYNNTRVYCQL